MDDGMKSCFVASEGLATFANKHKTPHEQEAGFGADTQPTHYMCIEMTSVFVYYSAKTPHV